MKDTYERRLARIKDILNDGKQSVEEDCDCRECSQIKAEAEVEGAFCELCGYRGRFAAIECACYDSRCWPSARGAGCFHGSLTCPVCEDGEKLSELIQKVRSELLGPPIAEVEPASV